MSITINETRKHVGRQSERRVLDRQIERYSMSINVEHEHLISLAEVPLHLPKRGGKKVHYSTVYRWTTKGARGRILESVMVGGIRYTTVEAVRRFHSASPPAHIIPSESRNDAIDEALRQAGV